jgi:uncharacterized membrane protein HdeD (DUF308 family)
MSTGSASLGQRWLHVIKDHAGTAIGVGILLVVTGLIAIAAPFAAGVSVMLMIGVMLMAAGIGLCMLAFRMGAFGAGLSPFLIGALMIVVGLYTVSRPVAALASMTLFLAAYFIVSGFVELFAAFGARPAPGWGWMATTGVVTLLLGVMLWRQFPMSGIWAVGTLFGLKLLFTGTSMLAIGMSVRRGVQGMQAATKS